MARRPRKTQLDLVALRLERLHRSYVWGPQVQVDVRPGVISFLQHPDASGYPGSLYPAWKSNHLRQAKVSVFGRDFKLVQFRGGSWEIYRIEPDGFTESFLGYDSDVLPSLLRGAYCKLEVPS